MLGNEKTIERLKRDAREGRIANAYLFCGDKGMGKKTLAQLFCLDIFCENGNSCRACAECRRVLSGNHPDIIRVTHEKPDIIKVDEVREQLCASVWIKPYGKRKIYIVDDAEKMAPQAQNAILKTLEEPPEYVTVILLCSDEKSMLDTVKSRCVKVSLVPAGRETIAGFLEKEYGADSETARKCAAFACGNPGAALRFFQDEDFQKLYSFTVELCRNIRTMDAGSMLRKAKELIDEGYSLSGFFELLSFWYRDVLMAGSGAGRDSIIYSGEENAIKRQAAYISAGGCSGIMEGIDKARRRINSNVSKELTLELLFLEMKEAV